MLDGALPGCPKLCFGAVDVRDVADLHLRAMTNPAAKGERFLAVGGDFMSMLDIARLLKARMGASAKRVPTFQLPNWVVRLAATRDPAVQQIVPELGKIKNATNEKARRMLAWPPRSREEAIVATAQSLVRLGLLKDSATRDQNNPGPKRL
jgi:dihydroflavonol-4-reductase